MTMIVGAQVDAVVAQPGRHFIGGEFCESLSGASFSVVNPGTEEVTTTAAQGGAADVNRAVAAAREAFESGVWSRAKPSHRRAVLMRVADLIDERQDEINQLESLEMGRPVGPAPTPGVPRLAVRRGRPRLALPCAVPRRAPAHHRPLDDVRPRRLPARLIEAFGVAGELLARGDR